MKNLFELKTTITGILLMIVGGFYFALPYFSERELWETNNWYLGLLEGVGLALMLAPDKIIHITFGWLQKKVNKT